MKRKSIEEYKSKKYGRLLILEEVEPKFLPSGKKVRQVLCLCDCGNTTIAVLPYMTTGKKSSCGCMATENALRNMPDPSTNTTHGHTKRKNGKPYFSPTYHTYRCMIQRCTHPGRKEYKNYGGRGIAVCDRWLESFENFLEDMGERPEGKTLDRFPDNDGNYEPSNCRWATKSEQRNNQRLNKKSICVNGECHSLSEWSKITGINRGTIWYRKEKGATTWDELFGELKVNQFG